MNEIYTVWVGGVEATDHYLTKEKAHQLADEYKQDGYHDVVVENNNTIQIKKHVKDMLTESFESMINNIDVLLNDDEEAVNNWEPDVNPMILPKCMVTALLEHESMQYQGKGTSFEKEVKKKVKELRNYL